jgi:hypothetical protein
MTNVIEKLRELSGIEGSVRDDEFDLLDAILIPFRPPQDYTVECVDRDFEEGGRWHNVESNVFKVEQNGEVAYFELWREVPATELQEGMDFAFGFYEVEPKEVTVIQYVRKEDAR